MSRFLLYVAGESGNGQSIELDTAEEAVAAVTELCQKMVDSDNIRLLTFSLGDMEATIKEEEVHGQG